MAKPPSKTGDKTLERPADLAGPFGLIAVGGGESPSVRISGSLTRPDGTVIHEVPIEFFSSAGSLAAEQKLQTAVGADPEPFDERQFEQALENIKTSGRSYIHKFLSEYFAQELHWESGFTSVTRSHKRRHERIMYVAIEARHGVFGKPDINQLAFIESSFAASMQEWQNDGRFHKYLQDRLGERYYSKNIPPVAERLERLKAYAEERGDEDVREYARLLFPEWNISERNNAGPTLPTEAPEKYQGLRGPETPPEFVKRVYGPWLGHGLTRADIRKLDSTLYEAIRNWSRRNEWPADVDLPTLQEENTRWVERVEKEGLASAIATDSPDAALREASRLLAAKHRRKER